MHSSAPPLWPPSDDAFLRLTTLDVSYNCLASDALQTLGDLPSLEHLDLSGNDLGALPSEVGPFSSLRKLVLANCGIDGAALLPLAPLPSLEELYMVRRAPCNTWNAFLPTAVVPATAHPSTPP